MAAWSPCSRLADPRAARVVTSGFLHDRLFLLEVFDEEHQQVTQQFDQVLWHWAAVSASQPPQSRGSSKRRQASRSRRGC